VLLANQGLRRSFAERSRQLVDGRGARRVAAALAGEVLPVNHASINLIRDAGYQQSACRFACILKDHADD